MKKVIGFIVVVLVISWLILIFFPSLFINKAKIVEFQDEFNNQHDWINISLVPDKIKISYDAGFFYKPHYKISIPNMSSTFEGNQLIEYLTNEVEESVYHLPEELNIANKMIEANIDEAVLIYGPFDKYMAFRGADTIRLTDIESKDTYNNEKSSVKMFINSIKSDDIEISSLLGKPGSTNESLKNILIDNNVSEFNLNDINIELLDNEALLKINIDSLSLIQKSTKDLLALLYKGYENNHLDAIFSSGSEYQSSKLILRGANLVKQTSDNRSLQYDIEEGSLYINFKPSEEKTLMSFGTKIILVNLNGQLKSDNKGENEIINKLADIQELKGAFQIDRISSDMLKNYIQFNRSIDGGKQLKQSELIKTRGYIMSLQEALQKAKPTLSIEIKPVKHGLGMAEVEGNFNYKQNSMLPEGKIKIKTTDLGKIREQFTVNAENNNSDFLNDFDSFVKYFITREDGYSYSEIELKSILPFIYVNGEPVTSVIKK
mgnify:CR=1 FL=1